MALPDKSDAPLRAACAVIISARPHVSLLPRAAQSVLQQTFLPELLVVALSGVTREECKEARSSLAFVESSSSVARIPLLLLCTRDMQSSGQNRNRAAVACLRHDNKSTTFISFLDSDDLMLPQRLDAITKTMVEHSADLGLHSYLGASGCCHSPPRITTPRITTPAVAASLYANMSRCRHRHFRTRCMTEQAPLACRLADTCSTSRCAHSTSCIHFLPGSLQRVHYAHATVRGSVFGRLRQREAAAYGKVEDSWFARDMAALGMRIVVTTEALTFYNKSTIHVQPPGLLAIARQVKSSQVKSSQAKSSQVKTSQVKPRQGKANRVKASQGKSSGGSIVGRQDNQRSEDGGLATVQASEQAGGLGLATVQALLDRAVHSGAWHAVQDPLDPPHVHQGHQWDVHEHGPHGHQDHQWRWLPTATGGDGPKQWEPASCLWARRTLVLSGDSTVRDLHAMVTGTPTAEPWLDSASWSATALGCNATLGSGCADCWACCKPKGCGSADMVRGGRRGMMSGSKRAAVAAYLHRGWQDVIHQRVATETTMTFSWKPELWSEADRAAFAQRFCQQPPDLLYLGKGLHDSCRQVVSNVEALCR